MDTIVDIDLEHATSPTTRRVMDMVSQMLRDHPERETIVKDFGLFCFANAWSDDQAPQWFLDMHSSISDTFQDLPPLAVTEMLLRSLIATLVMDR